MESFATSLNSKPVELGEFTNNRLATRKTSQYASTVNAATKEQCSRRATIFDNKGADIILQSVHSRVEESMRRLERYKRVGYSTSFSSIRRRIIPSTTPCNTLHEISICRGPPVGVLLLFGRY